MVRFTIPCDFPHKDKRKVHKSGLNPEEHLAALQNIADEYKRSGGEIIEGNISIDICIVYPYYSKRLEKLADTATAVNAPDIDAIYMYITRGLANVAYSDISQITDVTISKILGIEPRAIVTLASRKEVMESFWEVKL